MFFDFILCLCELKLFLVLWSCLISNVFAIAAGPWNTFELQIVDCLFSRSKFKGSNFSLNLSGIQWSKINP